MILYVFERLLSATDDRTFKKDIPTLCIPTGGGSNGKKCSKPKVAQCTPKVTS